MDPQRRGGDGRATDRFFVVLWRRKWILLATALVLTACTAAISKSLPKIYQATSTLWVTEAQGNTAFDAVQAGEVLARTYARVADDPLLAARVANALPFDMSGGQVGAAMSFEPVSETQLLRFTAEDRDPIRARVLANTYAREFIDYSQSQLGDTAASEIAVANQAATPGQPERPKPTLYTLVGGLFGLVAGIAGAFLAELLDRRVRSVEEATDLLGAPALAQVPLRSDSAAAESAFQETFRLLRTNLQFMNRGVDAPRSLTVVSASEGDGKSSIAYNLAVAVAETGESVILVEADMRRPGLWRMALGDVPGPPSAGLSTWVVGTTGDIDDVIVETEAAGVSLVPAGVLPPFPSTLLDATRSRLLLDELTTRAHLVIVDTPPLSVGAEASTLAASADAALMVVDFRRSSKPALQSARHQLEVVGADLTGVIINRVRSLPEIGAYGYRYTSDNGPGGTGRRRRARRAERAG